MIRKLKKVHFIAIGGSVMHNLAITLCEQGVEITGSDDAVFDPAATKLKAAGLFPEKMGWDIDKIQKDLDLIVVGMHAKKNNPELLQAQKLGIKILSFPEFIRLFSEDKQRIVVGGSHGKTTITAMVMHVLNKAGRKFDYLVGADVEGFDISVRLSTNAPTIVVEGDEYFSSAIQRKPKLLLYDHHIGLISGIKWDHINVFPTIEDYVKTFEDFADSTPKAGVLIFNEEDDIATLIGRKDRDDVVQVEYGTHPHKIVDGTTYLITKKNGEIPLKIFGKHNLSNLMAAKVICDQMAVDDNTFYEAISSFIGAKKRLECIQAKDGHYVFKDYAHSPSKLQATTKAVKEQYPGKKLIACMELHTFSSLDKEFLNQYENSFSAADLPIIYLDPKVMEKKGEEAFDSEFLKKSFGRNDLQIFSDPEELKEFLQKQNFEDTNLLLMSSGNFSGIDLTELSISLMSQ
jgi:UDP-N-acetylmuramate: L-alanyl-gamma-D-glutamyl-meso-diaminopimelate ligase